MKHWTFIRYWGYSGKVYGRGDTRILVQRGTNDIIVLYHLEQ